MGFGVGAFFSMGLDDEIGHGFGFKIDGYFNLFGFFRKMQVRLETADR